MADSPEYGDPATELGTFFETVWGNTEGYVYLPIKEPATGDWRKVCFEWPAKEQSVIRHVLASVAKGLEVYFAPAIFSKADPKKENVLGTHVIWVDFDGNAPSWEAQNGTLPASDPSQALDGSDPVAASQRATTGRLAGVPAPSIRVQSSEPGHQHMYWMLDSFVTDVDFIDNVNKSLAYKMDADSSGWDANQILRPPHTKNFKRNKLVTVKDFNGRVFSPDSFAQLPTPERIISNKLSTDSLPEVDFLLANYQWDEQHYELFKKSEVDYGKRSSAIMQMAYFACEVGMSDLECFALIDTVDSKWGKFVNRSDRKQRLLDIVNKARIKHPRALSSTHFDGLLSTEVRYDYTIGELMKSEFRVDWAINGLIEMQGLGVVASLPGVGKTQWSLRLAMAQALGRSFLKWDCKEPRRILFFSLEMNAPAIREFIATMYDEFNDEERSLLDENFIVITFGETIALDTNEGRAFFETYLNEYRPAGIFIDSMGKLSNSELTEEKKIKELNAYYARIRKGYGSYIWFVHHNRKPNGDNKKPTALADLYGSQYIAAETSVAISLWKVGKQIEVDVIKSRLVQEIEPFNIQRTKTLDFEIVEPIGSGLLNHVGGDTNVNKSDNGGATKRANLEL